MFALLAGAGGFGAIYLNKEIVGKKHFTTWHGLFGLITCIGVLVAAAGGIIAKYNQYVKDYIRPINVKLYHATGSMIGKLKFIHNTFKVLLQTRTAFVIGIQRKAM